MPNRMDHVCPKLKLARRWMKLKAIREKQRMTLIHSWHRLPWRKERNKTNIWKEVENFSEKMTSFIKHSLNLRWWKTSNGYRTHQILFSKQWWQHSFECYMLNNLWALSTRLPLTRSIKLQSELFKQDNRWTRTVNLHSQMSCVQTSRHEEHRKQSICLIGVWDHL